MSLDLDRWYERSVRAVCNLYFKMITTAEKTYLLRYDEHRDEWSLQSGFDGDALLGLAGGSISFQ